VTLKGYFDHNKDIMIEKYLNGEKGVEIISPFYTHLNESEDTQAILVNRGWMCEDLKDFRYDRENNYARI
jgi:cytochrome oxidase assembly protein ShyY1